MNRDRTRLLHIRDAIATIRSYAPEKQTFLASSMVQDAVIRNLEIIGEAVKALEDDVKHMRPDIPWRQIAGMRDRLIHGYFAVDRELVWHVVSVELTVIDEAVTGLLSRMADAG